MLLVTLSNKFFFFCLRIIKQSCLTTLYILYFYFSMETACRSPMHYWDMTMDADMVVPTHSVVFSEDFFGNGDGIVRTGPFAHWRTTIGTPIIRNIGSGG